MPTKYVSIDCCTTYNSQIGSDTKIIIFKCNVMGKKNIYVSLVVDTTCHYSDKTVMLQMKSPLKMIISQYDDVQQNGHSGDIITYLGNADNAKYQMRTNINVDVTYDFLYVKLFYSTSPVIHYSLRWEDRTVTIPQHVDIINVPTTITQIIDSNKINTESKPTIKNKYAVVVGISDYLNVGDLEYCDEDAVSWTTYLKKLGYEVHLFGDRTSKYTPYSLDDYATEANIRNCIKSIATKIKARDQFVFVSSGHGSGDGKGNSFICCLDEDFVPQGEYSDKEMGNDIKAFTTNGAYVIVCFDNCYSGGMLEELCADSAANVCAISTCTANGYGYDDVTYQHGEWTEYFLEKTLIAKPDITILQDAFNAAIKNYPYSGHDMPQIEGNTKLMF